jgi:hypothetical protein
VLLTGNLAWGQHRMTARVPFDFSAPGGRLPAGQYLVVAGLDASQSIVKLYHTGTQKSFLLLHNRPAYARPNTEDALPRLVFHCEENGCSLAEIWPGTQRGWVFNPPQSASHQDRKIATVTIAPIRGQ